MCTGWNDTPAHAQNTDSTRGLCVEIWAGIGLDLLEFNGGQEGSLGCLVAIEIGAGQLGILESSQDLSEFRAMVEVLEVDRLVEEDVIQGVGGGELEAVRDPDRTVDARA